MLQYLLLEVGSIVRMSIETFYLNFMSSFTMFGGETIQATKLIDKIGVMSNGVYLWEVEVSFVYFHVYWAEPLEDVFGLVHSIEGIYHVTDFVIIVVMEHATCRVGYIS